jgi:hypothetical protein
VDVIDEYGCMVRSYYFTVNTAASDPPSICIVTVDSATGKNLVVWERPVSNLIDSYYVYKETIQSDLYELIGKLGYNDLSVFLDTNSNPAVKADRYRISIIDSCGIESALSPPHKTMHLTINKGINGENNLIWDHYVGFAFNSYKILRGNSPGSLRPVALIQNNLTSYSDINPPAGLLFYQVVVVKPDPCYPDILRAQTSAGPYSQSVSNLKDYSTITQYYLSVYPSEKTIPRLNNSSATFTIYTNLTNWTAYGTETWFTVINDMANKSLIVTVTENTDQNPRYGFIVLNAPELKDSIMITIIQTGTIGIKPQGHNLNTLEIYPNPFYGYTNISYNLNSTGNVRADVFDLYGRYITTLADQRQTPGTYNLKFSASELGCTEGVYYLRLRVDGFEYVRKMVELK